MRQFHDDGKKMHGCSADDVATPNTRTDTGDRWK